MRHSLPEMRDSVLVLVSVPAFAPALVPAPWLPPATALGRLAQSPEEEVLQLLLREVAAVAVLPRWMRAAGVQAPLPLLGHGRTMCARCLRVCAPALVSAALAKVLFLVRLWSVGS